MEDTRAQNWEYICRKFHNQYKYNIEVDVMKKDMETTKQEPKESFAAFITKWRSKATQMMNKPNEVEKLTMVVKNLLPIHHKYLFAQYFPNFKALRALALGNANAISKGNLAF